MAKEGLLKWAEQAVKHMSNFSMGADIGDINNDGLMDVFVADMVAEDNFRGKTNMSGMDPNKFWNLVNSGYHYQYMFNSMQLNNGGGRFSEIAQLSGVSNTDWSWSPMLVDFDLDGYKDLFVTNGLMRDIRNKDHGIWLKKETIKFNSATKGKSSKEINEGLLELSKQAPSIKIPNYAYKNLGNLEFKNVSTKWGLDLNGWSHGSCSS